MFLLTIVLAASTNLTTIFVTDIPSLKQCEAAKTAVSKEFGKQVVSAKCSSSK